VTYSQSIYHTSIASRRKNVRKYSTCKHVSNSNPDSKAEYCDECVVCLSVRHHVFVRIFTKFYVHITYGCGSVLLWQSSDKLIKLHISSFMDDVIFAHKLCH